MTDFTDTTLSTQHCILFIYTVLHHKLLYYLTHSSHCDTKLYLSHPGVAASQGSVCGSFWQTLLQSLSHSCKQNYAKNPFQIRNQKSNPNQWCLCETLSHLVQFTVAVCPISLSSTGHRGSRDNGRLVNIKDLRFETYVCVFLCVMVVLMCVWVYVCGRSVTNTRDAHSCGCVEGLQGHACVKCHFESHSNLITPARSVTRTSTETDTERDGGRQRRYMSSVVWAVFLCVLHNVGLVCPPMFFGYFCTQSQRLCSWVCKHISI